MRNHVSGISGHLATLLRTHREGAGLTQKQLAAEAGISLGALQDLEQGRTARPRRQSLDRLAAVLRLSADQREALTHPPAAPAAAGKAAATEHGDDAGPAHAGHTGHGLRIEVLGPLALWRDGLPLALGSVRQRAVLGLLVLHADTGLHRATIAEALWSEDPPPTSATMIQAQVSRIRRLLGPGPAHGGSVRLSWDGSGYRLSLDGVRFDVTEFGDLAAHARQAAAAGDAATACEGYDRALRLWRGQPLEDIEMLYAHPAMAELARRRADAVIEYAVVAVPAGQPGRVVAHLEALATRDPLDERAHAQLMLALAATGRQAAALRVYQELAARLDAELGVRPGPELCAVHLRVLRQRVSVASSTATVDAARSAPTAGSGNGHRRAVAGKVTPRQLPPAVDGFAGRAAELEALTGILDRATGTGGTVVISAIGGTAGVGKTTLAVRWAHQVIGRFPDGQLYVNLRGFGPAGRAATAAEAVRLFLDGLGVAPEGIPTGLDAQTALYRSLLAGKRMLVVVDNARDPAQVRPLLPGAPGCLVLVTSRNQLTGLAAGDGAHLLTLDVLTEAEARELLERRLGRERVAAEPEAVTELTVLCARLPLALSIAAARVSARPTMPIAALAAELCGPRSRLDALGTGDAVTDVRAVFSWSCRHLTGSAARIFRLLGLHPGPDISRTAAASLAGVPLGQACVLLDELGRANLLSEPAPGRFTSHDLLRDYAAEQAREVDGRAVCEMALLRMLDHYLHTARAAELMLDPLRPAVPMAAPQPGVTLDDLTGDQALAWFEAEHRALLAVIVLAADLGFDAHVWQLPRLLEVYFHCRSQFRDWSASQHTALEAARRLGNHHAQAGALRGIASAQIELGCQSDALGCLAEALCLYQQCGDLREQARVHLDIARALEHQGRYRDALSHSRRSLRISRSAGDAGQPVLAAALNHIGWYLSLIGNHKQALGYCQQALARHRQLGERYQEALTLDSLAFTLRHLGQYAQAADCYRQAVEILTQSGYRYKTAETLGYVGDAYQQAGDVAAARDAWTQALAILDDLRHPEADQMRSRLGRHLPAP